MNCGLYFLSILLFFVSVEATAFVPCPYARVSKTRELESLNLKIDARWMTGHLPQTDLNVKINGVPAQQYLNATGVLSCDGKRVGSGNVVCGGKVVVMAGHSFFDPENCEATVQPQACTFGTSVSKGPIEVPIKSVQSSGYNCDQNKNQIRHIDDWTVAILEKSLVDANDPKASVTPYEVRDGSEFKIGQSLVGACGMSMDVIKRDQTTGILGRPKNWSRCEKKEEFTDGDWSGVVGTTCSAAHGCSGGGLLDENRRLVAIAVNTPGESTDDMVALARRPDLNYHAKPCAYDVNGKPEGCKTLYVPIKGDFAEAIRAACEATK